MTDREQRIDRKEKKALWHKTCRNAEPAKNEVNSFLKRDILPNFHLKLEFAFFSLINHPNYILLLVHG